MQGKNPEAIRAVLLDFGGVVADEGFMAGLKTVAKAQGLDGEKVWKEGMNAVYDSGYVLGKGDEASFWKLLQQRTGLKGDPNRLREKILSLFRLRPKVLACNDNIRAAGYITGILSDQTDWIYRIHHHRPFLHRFDVAFISFQIGIGKRDPTLFQYVIDRLGVSGQGILFIDDQPGNVQRARQAGMHAHCANDEDEVVSILEEHIPEIRAD